MIAAVLRRNQVANCRDTQDDPNLQRAVGMGEGMQRRRWLCGR